MPSNKGMELTKLVSARMQADVPIRAFRRFASLRTASQLVPGVRRTWRRGLRLRLADDLVQPLEYPLELLG
jgi:hypothetical protein